MHAVDAGAARRDAGGPAAAERVRRMRRERSRVLRVEYQHLPWIGGERHGRADRDGRAASEKCNSAPAAVRASPMKLAPAIFDGLDYRRDAALSRSHRD